MLPESVRSYVHQAGSIANTHFLAIPFNSDFEEDAYQMSVKSLLFNSTAHDMATWFEKLGDFKIINKESVKTLATIETVKAQANSRTRGIYGIECGSNYATTTVGQGNSLDERRVFYISPNNVKEIIDNDNNDEIIFSAIYSYNSDGYPTSNSFSSKSGSNHSDVEVYSY